MNTKRINGATLEKMLRNGLANLRQHEEELNDLNVFPVSDGDTGTNMSLTLEHGIRLAPHNQELGAYLKALTDGMLLGARGNSGVILSQLFRGVFSELSRCGDANVNDFRNAFIRAYKTAYRAVVCPVEGTILTVAREGIEHIRTQIDRSTTMEALLSIYVAEMQKTLAYTPQLLPVLKESGVIDSGGAGYIYIIDGMRKYLYGEILRDTQSADAPQKPEADNAHFNEDSAFSDGYCMEYLLQLMSAPKYNQRFRLEAYVDDLKLYGTSLVVTQDAKRVKVHIHTLLPAKVIAASQEYGEFISFKLENMQLQHNEHMAAMKKKREHTPLGIISVANGAGLQALFTDLGCGYVLDGGETMNVSSQEFLRACKDLNADRIFILPNNKNAVLAAQQAASLLEGVTVDVINTANVMDGYFALSMDIPDSTDAAYRLCQLQQGAKSVTTLAVTTATRDYSGEKLSCKAGEAICLCDDTPVSASPDWLEAIVAALRQVPDIDDKETCLVFRGDGIPCEWENQLQAAVCQAFPQLELTFLDGGQPIYAWLLGLI